MYPKTFVGWANREPDALNPKTCAEPANGRADGPSPACLRLRRESAPLRANHTPETLYPNLCTRRPVQVGRTVGESGGRLRRRRRLAGDSPCHYGHTPKARIKYPKHETLYPKPVRIERTGGELGARMRQRRLPRPACGAYGQTHATKPEDLYPIPEAL